MSKRMRPGLIAVTPPSGPLLPLPMRASAGFLVYDLSGKTRIQIWPPRRTWRVIARRAPPVFPVGLPHTSNRRPALVAEGARPPPLRLPPPPAPSPSEETQPATPAPHQLSCP